MRPEDRLIIESILSRFREAPKRSPSRAALLAVSGRLDWPYVIAALKKEGVASIFYQYLQQDGAFDLVPPDALSALKGCFIANLKANLTAIARAKKAFAHMKASGIDIIVLKGLYFIELVYPHPAMRGLSDIDILVHRDDVRKVDACLGSLGYAAMDGTPDRVLRNPSGYLASLDYIHAEVSGPHLHVHYHVVNTSVPAYMFAPGIDMGRIWEKAADVRIADTEVQVLCPEHALIYLCEHALRVGHSFDRLVLAHDICMLMAAQDREMNWSAVLRESRALHLERFLVVSLATIEIFAGPLLPENFRKAFKDLVKLNWGERLFLNLHEKNRRFRGSSYFIYLALNRGPLQKIRFVTRTLFPPLPILCQRRYIRDEYDIRLFFSLYIDRIVEILGHLQSWLVRVTYNRS